MNSIEEIKKKYFNGINNEIKEEKSDRSHVVL